MQNFIHSKRQYVVSQKLLGSVFKYNLNKYKICNTMSTNINLTYQLYGIKTKKLMQIPLLHSKNQSFGIYFPSLCNARNFSTSSIYYQQPNDPTESNKDPKKDKSNDPNESVLFAVKIFSVLSFIMLTYLVFVSISLNNSAVVIPWPDFIHELLLKGQVQEIIIRPFDMQIIVKPGATYKGKSLDYRYIVIKNNRDLNSVEDQIRAIEKRVGIKTEDGISIRYVQNNTKLAMSSLLLWAIFFAGAYAVYRHPLVKKSLSNIMPFSKANYTLVEPFLGKGVHFKDVAGLKEAKIEVMEFVDYLKNSEKYTKLGAKVPKGALLLGPPGCGKTLLAKAVATEASVPFLSMNGSEFTELIGGLGAARVRDLFAEAKKRAPSIIYIDEIDAIGKKRADSYVEGSNSESERTLNQLLVEMDGMIAAKDVIILASTNRSEVLDKALLRCGRFDRHILIDLPTLQEREQIFEYHLQSLSLEGKPNQYSKYLAHLTPGFSGADIANICNEAALHAASEKKVKVDNNDLMYAIDKVLGGTVKRSSTLTPSEKKTIVYHEAGHALAAWLLEHSKPLIKVTVVPRTNRRLGFSQYSDSNLKLQTSDYLLEYMCVLLGGRVAENIIFNKVSTGAQNDLEKVTEIAYRQVQQFGMSPSVGLVSFDKELTTTKNKKPYSKKLGRLMDAEVRRIIIEAYKKTEKLLQDNRDKLIILAETLLKKETLTYKDIEALIGPPPFGKKDLMDLQTCNPDIE